MNSLLVRAASLACIIALAACSGMSTATPPQVSSAAAQYAQLQREIPDALPGPQSGFIPFRTANPVVALCPPTNEPDTRRCMSYVRTDVTPGASPDHIQYGPPDLQSAYKLPSSTQGKGQTVAIVDAYGYPNAQKDLAYYRNFYGLPACTVANNCLRIVNQSGSTSPLPAKNNGWDGEQALDLDMVSAICPNCHILLVQANNNKNVSLDAAVNTAVRLGAKIVSNSYGGSEGGIATDSAFEHSGVVFVASAGDDGAAEGPQTPCGYQGVVCAGGTALVRASNGRGWSEKAWNDIAAGYGATGSGCSVIIARPSWQNQSICAHRAEADVSANAAVSTPVIIRHSGFWYYAGGTSEAAPILGAVFALAGNAGKVSEPQGVWKAAKSHFFDVVKGSNVTSSPCPFGANKYICNARKGYDGPTGWGTPNGVGGF